MNSILMRGVSNAGSTLFTVLTVVYWPPAWD